MRHLEIQRNGAKDARVMIGNHRDKDECKGYKKLTPKKSCFRLVRQLVDEKLLKMTNKTSWTECMEINIILNFNQNAGNGGVYRCNIEM